MNRYLSAWKDASDPITVWFDSVTTLLQDGDVRRIFRFLAAMTTRVRNVGAFAHYHVEPGAHDEWTLATVADVFRGVFEYDPAADAWRPA